MTHRRAHTLKTWKRFFGRIRTGEKTVEVRENDRDFQTGDVLILQEFDEVIGKHTGEEFHVVVTHILYGGQFGIQPGYVAMSIKLHTH